MSLINSLLIGQLDIGWHLTGQLIMNTLAFVSCLRCPYPTHNFVLYHRVVKPNHGKYYHILSSPSEDIART